MVLSRLTLIIMRSNRFHLYLLDRKEGIKDLKTNTLDPAETEAHHPCLMTIKIFLMMMKICEIIEF